MAQTTTAQHAASGIHYHLPRSRCSLLFLWFSIGFLTVWFDGAADWNGASRKQRRKYLVYALSARKRNKNSFIRTLSYQMCKRSKIKRECKRSNIKELTDIMAPIHSISNTVYNHFHIFADTSFICARFAHPPAPTPTHTPRSALDSMSAEQDTYNSIVLIHNVIFTYNVFTLILIRSRELFRSLFHSSAFPRPSSASSAKVWVLCSPLWQKHKRMKDRKERSEKKINSKGKKGDERKRTEKDTIECHCVCI